MNYKRVLSIIRKEFFQIKRDKRTIAIIILMPIMELLLFGYAASTSVDHIPTVVFNNDIGIESRELLGAFVNSQYFDLDYNAKSIQEIEEYIDNGESKAGIVIPPEYSADIKNGKTAQIQLIVDGTDPTTAQTILSSAGGVVQSMSIEIINETRGISVPQSLDLRSRVWYNPDMSSINFNIPGLIGVILQTVTLMLTSFSIVRERERGTMFPREAMPSVIHGLSTVLPLTYFIEVLRGIILKGNGFAELYEEFFILVAFGLGFLILATLKFKKKID